MRFSREKRKQKSNHENVFYIIHRDNPTGKCVCVCVCVWEGGGVGGSLASQLVPCVNEKRTVRGYREGS